ncbi:MAG: HlyD family efflux transporter periplasmic adaptor subunit [Clostridia bacterium]|nr:HlyD family efflux transporter periplasmic adaptor subunit [Clostridia bacterium]
MKKNFKRLLIICAAVAIFISAYFIFNPPSDKEMVFSGSLENTTKHMGIIIRNEKKVETNLSGTISAKVADGTLVPSGKLIAAVINENADKNVQSELAKINKRIDEIESAKKVSDNFTDDIYKLDSKISEKVSSLIYYTNIGDAKKCSETKAEITALYDKKNKVGGEGAAVKNDLESLNNQKKELEARLAEYEQNVYAPEPGVFISHTDGYEDILSIDNVKNLKYSDFKNISDSLKKKEEKNEADKNEIKLIDNYMWCVAVAADNERCADFEIGEEVFIRINDDSKNIKGNVMSISDDKGAKGVIVISTTAYDANSYMQRSVDVELIKNIYSGLKVPVSALIKKDGKDGVYAVSDNAAKFKTVEIVYKGEKYAIVKENNADANSLLLYDEVLTSPDKVYNGKILK